MKIFGLYVSISRRDPFEVGVRAGQALAADHAAYVLGEAPTPRQRVLDDEVVIGFPVGARRGVPDGWQVAR